MPSPFPEVDPFIEANGRWLGFHNALITYLAQFLNAALPEGYAANIEERIQLVEVPPRPPRQRLPDVGLTLDPPARRPGGPTGGAVATLEPAILTLPDVLEVPEAYIEVVQLPGLDLVSGIEVLSPTNKTSPGRGEYLGKRRDLLRRGVHLVEIDLLSGGERPETVEPLPPGDYFAFVSRADRRPTCEVYRWGVRDAIPKVPVPLRAPDADVWVDLAAVFTTAYDGGRYRQTLRYDAEPPPSLAPADCVWARAVAAHGRS